MKRHQGDKKTFAELTPDEQAKSINIMLINIGKAIKKHIQDSKGNEVKTRVKCINKVAKLITKISEI